MGTEEDSAHRTSHMGYLGARLPTRLCVTSKEAQGPVLIAWLLSAKSQVSGPAGTLLLPQLPWRGLHCPQPSRPCSPLRLGVGSRSMEASGWLWTPLLLSDIVLQSLRFSLCGGPVGVEGDSLFPHTHHLWGTGCGIHGRGLPGLCQARGDCGTSGTRPATSC